MGKSSCSSFAPKAINRSKTSSTTSSGLPSFLSILLMIAIGFKLCLRAFPNTNFV
jgi:hypothetical protein